ncbi:MAG: hypothetical protein Q7S29_03275 [Candidatus Peribacter sp.]|nr:hypothetical protein [Candidatus Peribacter sp.]
MLARPDEADGADRKESAFLTQKDLEVGEGGQAFLSSRGVPAFEKQCSILLHGLRGHSRAHGWQILGNPRLCPVKDEGGIGVLL